jgi:hypothetical protein
VLANKNIEKTKIMNTDKLKELINNSDSNQVHKNIMIGFIDRVNETESKYREDRKLIEEVGGVKHLDEVILSNDDVKIYTVTPSEKDERETKYHYRSIVKNKDGKWTRSCTVSPTFDIAYLVYLENKHIGLNSQFSEFAMKMLVINIED